MRVTGGNGIVFTVNKWRGMDCEWFFICLEEFLLTLRCKNVAVVLCDVSAKLTNNT